MAATLKTNFAGVTMPNPFMLSSAPPTTNCEMVARSFDAGWGGAVLKTLAYNLKLVQNVNPRISTSICPKTRFGCEFSDIFVFFYSFKVEK